MHEVKERVARESGSGYEVGFLVRGWEMFSLKFERYERRE